jgi:5-methyltetrahydrofolate--homocysteine methyltransferase
VTAVHAAYVAAGAEAVHTNTFGANALRLGRACLDACVRELNTRAVALARSASPKWVIGDMGPTGEYLPPMGHADAEAWHDAFREQAEALVEAGVDALHLETLGDVREALVALEAARDVAGDLPILVSLTCDRRPRGFRTLAGDRVDASWNALLDAGATVVGANCMMTSADYGALGEIAAGAGLRPVLQPNAGQPEVSSGGLRYPQPADRFACEVGTLAASAAAVGGCCGTTPAFIAALAARLRAGSLGARRE